LMSSVII